ncbi:MAG: divergent polysaccharide deacetylase family protein [Nitrospiraceae bacterium]|nr:MAG: divergent polysaccharide deacetylase family protein [Nitrospiraceae bacterium]
MKRSKSKHHIILILVFIIIATFALYEEFGKEKKPKETPRITKPEKKPEQPRPKPKVAIIMDDLGPNKNAAIAVFRLKAPLTLSILPQQPYSVWIAEEGHRLGHDIIAHIPMEATPAHKLGKGGLYTWMTETEIAETLHENFISIPFIIGASSHMGSAFTEDERAMQVVIKELKKKNLFFLDSLTSPRSVGYDLAKMHGLRALSRDLFLDDKDDPAEIKAQWEKMIEAANKKGLAILLAHPRKNTLEFLRKALKENNAVTVVPVSELIK